MIPRQLVNQPAVDGAKAELPVCSTFLSFFSAVSKQPRHLCSRKISRKLQTRRLADLLCVPLLRNLLRNAACAAALPYNCLFQRFPGRLVPDRRRLTLIADADSGDFFRCNTGLCHQRFYRLYCIPVNLIQIMGHPSLFIDNLPVRQVGTAE